jgi:hypothetical protein
MIQSCSTAAKSCSTAAEVWWNGLGAALIGGVTAALVATGVVFTTRAYERRHVKEQEARTAARELMKDSRTFVDSFTSAALPSPDHQLARLGAYVRWMTAAQVAQASLQPVSPELSRRINEAASRLLPPVEAAAAIEMDTDEAWMEPMGQTLLAATAPVLRLTEILANWIGTGQVLDFEQQSHGVPAP